MIARALANMPLGGAIYRSPNLRTDGPPPISTAQAAQHRGASANLRSLAPPPISTAKAAQMLGVSPAP